MKGWKVIPHSFSKALLKHHCLTVDYELAVFEQAVAVAVAVGVY